MSPIAVGARVPRRGGAATRALGRAMLAAMRFGLEGEVPDLPKFVVAVAPHTSNWDFVVGAAARFALDLDLAFIGKHTLFRGPFAPLLRGMGGIPVDRSSPHGLVDDKQELLTFSDGVEGGYDTLGGRNGEPDFALRSAGHACRGGPFRNVGFTDETFHYAGV